MPTRCPAPTFILTAALFFALPLAAQDPGSMASKVNKPSPCGDAQILKYNATSGLFECQDEGAGGGQGDNISVNATAAADANFIDSARIAFSLNAAPVPDEISADIVADALGPASIDETADYAFTGKLLGIGALTCGAGTAGKARVHTTPLQYCDNTATPALRYAAYGDAGGNALSGDSATAFFASGTVEATRLPDLENLNGTLDLPSGGTGGAPAGDDQLLLSDSAAAATWRTLPACGSSATDKLLYDAATNTFSCAADQNSGGAPAWENLINGSDAATAYTSDATAETLTFDFTAPFSTGSQFLVRQQAGNPTGGTLAEFQAADSDLTLLRVNNSATPLAQAWTIYSGEDRSSFSSLMQAYIDGGFNSFTKLNGSTNSKNTVALGVNQDDGISAIYGLYGAVESAHASGSRASAYAVEGDAYNTNAGNLTELAGVATYAEQDGAGTVSGMFGVRIFSNLRTAGTVLTNYGMRIDSQVGVGNNNWAIRTDGGLVEVRTGDAATVGLAVRGDAGQTANLQEWRDSTDTTLAQVTAGGALDSTVGYRVGGAAPTGRYLRGDGTNFVQSSGAAAGTGSCTNQFVRTLNDDAAPTCASIGSADITDGDLTSADLAAPNKTLQITYTFFDPANDLPATLDVPSIYANRARAITLQEVYCEIDAGSASINLQRDDGSPADVLSAALACSTAGATSTSFVAGEDALAVGQNLDHVTVSAGAGLHRLNVAITYTID